MLFSSYPIPSATLSMPRQRTSMPRRFAERGRPLLPTCFRLFQRACAFNGWGRQQPCRPAPLPSARTSPSDALQVAASYEEEHKGKGKGGGGHGGGGHGHARGELSSGEKAAVTRAVHGHHPVEDLPFVQVTAGCWEESQSEGSRKSAEQLVTTCVVRSHPFRPPFAGPPQEAGESAGVCGGGGCSEKLRFQPASHCPSIKPWPDTDLPLLDMQLKEHEGKA